MQTKKLFFVDYCVPDQSCAENSDKEDYSNDLSEEKKVLDQKLLKALSKILQKKNRLGANTQSDAMESD